MLAKIVPPTNDFIALARYLVQGKERPTNPNRVAWIAGQNLGTSDPELAADFMQATAALSKRTKNATYHVMIAWHARERPAVEVMQEVAFKTLALAGLAEHQALIMGHGDKPHQHLHMLINRVHPVTGKAWKQSHDYARFDAIMRQLSDEYGFEHVPAHLYNPEQTDHLPKKPNSRATYAAKRGAKTRRIQWSRNASRKLGARLSERFDQSTTWDDVETAIADEGLALETKGSGFVVGTAAAYATFSSLGLTVSAQSFEKRFQRPYRTPTVKTERENRSVFSVDAVDIAKWLASWGLISTDDVRRTIDESVVSRREKQADASLAMQLALVWHRRWASATGLTPHRPPMPKGRHHHRDSPKGTSRSMLKPSERRCSR